ncbi:MAG: hypothetical protein JW891_00405 [Candidatus Lokiarchaeota archaeon]|nr:hypothetical protein [Candidatus Lokiarchaeota archaeon]
MKKKIQNILIICTGNTARSPAAEYLARYHADRLGIDLNFDSAGFINAFTYMQPESQQYLDEKGIDHSDFKPKIVNKTLLKEHDLIITMENRHMFELIENFGDIENIKEKTITLKAFNDKKGDIVDPYYTNRRTYLKILKEIDENIKMMVHKIIKINENV